MTEETLGFDANTSADHIEQELLQHHSSMISKVVERDELNRQIENFLASGGRIDSVDVNVMTDPPKKPENHYGSHPI